MLGVVLGVLGWLAALAVAYLRRRLAAPSNPVIGQERAIGPVVGPKAASATLTAEDTTMSAFETTDPTNQAQLDADNKAFVERMNKMLAGELQAPNETVDYLLKAYKDDLAEVNAMSEAIVKLRGRIESREADLRVWDKKAAAPTS